MKIKTLAMLLCAVMVISSAASGTIAYLTDEGGVVNRFTVGKVDIRVDETPVNPDGTPIEGQPPRTEEGNEYHLIPGGEYTKDPAVTVLKGSESSYIRMRVTITKFSALKAVLEALKSDPSGLYPDGLPQEHVRGWDPQTWVYHSTQEDAAKDSVTYEFRYHDKNNGNPAQAQIYTLPENSEDAPLPPLFEKIVVPGGITSEQLATLAQMEIKVIGQAVQAEGFADAQAAWAAFDAQTATPAEAQAGE